MYTWARPVGGLGIERIWARVLQVVSERTLVCTGCMCVLAQMGRRDESCTEGDPGHLPHRRYADEGVSPEGGENVIPRPSISVLVWPMWPK